MDESYQQRFGGIARLYGVADRKARVDDTLKRLGLEKRQDQLAGQLSGGWKQRMALAAHQVLGCRGVSRTDFRYDDTGARPRLILLETNTQPGMTPTSLVPEQAAHVGMSYADLVLWMVEHAQCDG